MGPRHRSGITKSVYKKIPVHQIRCAPHRKRKMAMDDADYILYGSLVEMMGRERGLSFMKKLAQQDLIIRSGHSLLTQLLIGGEFPIYLDGFGSNIEKFKAQGAPIDWVALEPVIVSLNPVGMAVNAPHPNSARQNFSCPRKGRRSA